jgi:hypothetical protein
VSVLGVSKERGRECPSALQMQDGQGTTGATVCVGKKERVKVTTHQGDNMAWERIQRAGCARFLHSSTRRPVLVELEGGLEDGGVDDRACLGHARLRVAMADSECSRDPGEKMGLACTSERLTQGRRGTGQRKGGGS